MKERRSIDKTSSVDMSDAATLYAATFSEPDYMVPGLSADYKETGALRQLCIKYGCTGILVHHLRKAGSPYAVDQVLGTTGLTAAVDCWWLIMDDPQNPEYKVVEVRGRSMPETMLRIGFRPSGSSPGSYVIDEGIDLRAGVEGRKIMFFWSTMDRKLRLRSLGH